MKRIVLFTAALALACGVRAETFTVDKDHAEIGFTVKHLMISNVKGSFNTFEGTIKFDLAGGKLVSMAGWIDAASIDTNNEKRDGHLKSGDFFNVSEYPLLVFKSTSIEKTGENSYSVTGNINVLGEDREVVLPVTVAGPIDDPWGNKRIGLSCQTTLNRRDLGITNSPASMISDEVGIDISAEAVFRPAS